MVEGDGYGTVSQGVYCSVLPGAWIAVYDTVLSDDPTLSSNGLITGWDRVAPVYGRDGILADY